MSDDPRRVCADVNYYEREKFMPDKTDDTKKEIEESVKEAEKKKTDRYCSVCNRPESVTGPLVTLGDMSVCNDCMQKSMDYMRNSNFDLGSLFKGLSNFPNISFLNFGGEEAPRKAPKPPNKAYLPL